MKNIMRKARLEKGMTLNTASKLMGIPRTRLFNYETGRTRIPYDTVIMAAKVLSIPANKIIPSTTPSSAVKEVLKKDIALLDEDEIMEVDQETPYKNQFNVPIKSKKLLKKLKRLQKKANHTYLKDTIIAIVEASIDNVVVD